MRESVYESRFHQYSDRYTITGSTRYTNIHSYDILMLSPGSPLSPYSRFRGNPKIVPSYRFPKVSKLLFTLCFMSLAMQAMVHLLRHIIK